MMEKKYIVIAVAMIIAFLIHGAFVGRAITRFKKEDRSISVKGFSEKEVKSNMAVWTIKIRITTNDLTEGSKEIEDLKNKVIQFLLKNQITSDELVQKELNVNDKLAQDYGNDNVFKYRYIIENVMQVRSTNVDNIQKISRMTDELLKAGVVVSSNQEYNPSVKYMYTKLNEIKTAMLSEATLNAKGAALEFAKNNEVSLGKLKRANQGLFTISDRDDAMVSQSDANGYELNVNDVFKRVRVVINVEYSID